METVTLPKTTYNKILKRARAFDRFLDLSQKEYPLEEYSSVRVGEFKKADKISPATKKAIASFLSKKKYSG